MTPEQAPAKKRDDQRESDVVGQAVTVFETTSPAMVASRSGLRRSRG